MPPGLLNRCEDERAPEIRDAERNRIGMWLFFFPHGRKARIGGCNTAPEYFYFNDSADFWYSLLRPECLVQVSNVEFLLFLSYQIKVTHKYRSTFYKLFQVVAFFKKKKY